MADRITPVDVVDRMLWREAQRILDRHVRSDGDEVCRWCAAPWPCAPRRLAERAEAEAYRPTYEAWSSRLDLREMPGWQGEFDYAEAG